MTDQCYVPGKIGGIGIHDEASEAKWRVPAEFVASLMREAGVRVEWRDPWWNGYRTFYADGRPAAWACDQCGHYSPWSLVGEMVYALTEMQR